MESINLVTSQKGNEKMEIVLKCVIDVSKQTIKELVEALNVSWVNPRVTEEDYPFQDSFSGKWDVELLRPRRKMKFEDIVRATREDGWQTGTVYHLLTLFVSQDGKSLSGSFMAPGSLCTDDFEYSGCVVLSVAGDNKKIGLGNWRGSKIGGYDIVRIKRKQDALVSDGVA